MNQLVIEDGFIIVAKEKKKTTRLERKAYVVYSLERFFSESLEIFPVRLNTAKLEWKMCLSAISDARQPNKSSLG